MASKYYKKTGSAVSISKHSVALRHHHCQHNSAGSHTVYRRIRKCHSWCYRCPCTNLNLSRNNAGKCHSKLSLRRSLLIFFLVLGVLTFLLSNDRLIFNEIMAPVPRPLLSRALFRAFWDLELGVCYYSFIWVAGIHEKSLEVAGIKPWTAWLATWANQ